jgi:hypothetical protein
MPIATDVSERILGAGGGKLNSVAGGFHLVTVVGGLVILAVVVLIVWAVRASAKPK